MQKCLDNYNTTFASFPMMLDYHQTQSESSQWVRCPVKEGENRRNRAAERRRFQFPIC